MKKVLALVLAAMMVLAIAPMSVSAAPSLGICSQLNLKAGWQYTYLNGDPVAAINFPTTEDGVADLFNTKVNRNSGAELRIYLTPGFGKDEVRSGEYDVQVRWGQGGKKAISSVGFDYDDYTWYTTDKDGKQVKHTEKDGQAYIKIKFPTKFVSTSSLDYNFLVYLTKEKYRVDGYEWEVEGNLSNWEQGVDADYDYAYLYDRPVVDADEYNKLVELELGEGVTIFAKVFEGKKYYGYASQSVKSEDDDVISAYPAIGSIYYLDTIGLNNSGNYVVLDVDDSCYVYNADLEYIGKGGDNLPYSTKYYVATEELDVAVDEPVDAPADEPATNPDMGGDDVPENVNDNPGTGC